MTFWGFIKGVAMVTGFIVWGLAAVVAVLAFVMKDFRM